eukprot:55512-Pyramimonas_sp.AAC.1
MASDSIARMRVWMGDRQGNFMKKPWTIASTFGIVTSVSERKRDGAHARVEARGADCRLAEDYAGEFAEQ